jgi:hypothetical protein
MMLDGEMGLLTICAKWFSGRLALHREPLSRTRIIDLRQIKRRKAIHEQGHKQLGNYYDYYYDYALLFLTTMNNQAPVLLRQTGMRNRT